MILKYKFKEFTPEYIKIKTLQEIKKGYITS